MHSISQVNAAAIDAHRGGATQYLSAGIVKRVNVGETHPISFRMMIRHTGPAARRNGARYGRTGGGAVVTRVEW